MTLHTHSKSTAAHMASTYIIQQSLNRGPSCLFVVLTVIFSLTEGTTTIQLKGEAGGNVTFQCPMDSTRTITFFYFQREDSFLNGYHASKTIPTARLENTRVDHPSTHVHMFGLSISDAGMYQCIIQYNGSKGIDRVHIQLTVTASYSEPTVTQSCDDVHCLVTCASYGGYPGTPVAWIIPGSSGTNSQLWRVENNTQVSSPSTMLVNSTSTVDFNCSNGELKNLSCSVGSVTSTLFSVCKTRVKTDSNIIITIAAALGVALILVCVGVYFCCRCKRGQRGKDCRKNGNKEELKDLKGRRYEELDQFCEKNKEKDEEDPVDGFNTA